MVHGAEFMTPDIGRGKREKSNDWLGPQNGSGAPFPSAEVKEITEIHSIKTQ